MSFKIKTCVNLNEYNVLKELIEEEKAAINFFFNHLDQNKLEPFFDFLVKCKGTIICSGIGKSGYVAEKVAMTFTSTGTKAIYISPNNALHGDIGFVTKDDVILFFSKSGESDELLAMLPTLRNRGTKVASIVMNSKSRLAKASDFIIEIPHLKELCPFNMVPTISCVTQMIVGDLFVIALMKARNFDTLQYAQNHPAGRIGKRLSLKVCDLMIRDEALPKVTLKEKLSEILVELSNKRCGCVLVINENEELEGIFTDGDLGRILQKQGAKAMELAMSEIMTKNPHTIDPEKLALEAMDIMEANQKNAITVLPVVDEKKNVKGLIRLHDIVQSGV